MQEIDTPFSSLTQLREAFQKKTLSFQEFYQALFQKIKCLDTQTQAFLSINEAESIEKAKHYDEKVAKGEKLLTLEGLPIAIKDNIHIQGQKSTCASKMLENFKAPFDATVIQKLKAKGMIFVGKTNMDEFAMGSTTESSAFQKTYNPWDLDCTPGGSSGGSAAAVAADLVPVSLGSDTGGSIRQPAAFCGISGFKPTYGTVSRYGLVAFASSLDQIGPLARRCEDLSLIYEAIAGHDPHDATTTITQAKKNHDSSFVGKTFIIPASFVNSLAPEIQNAFHKNCEELRQLGASFKEVDLSSFDLAVATYYILAPAEASSNLARFDGVRYTQRAEGKNLETMMKATRGSFFGSEVKRRILLGTHVLSSGYYDAYYQSALNARHFIREELKEALADADGILCPTTPSPAFSITGHESRSPLELYLCDIATIPANISGFPALSIPAGFVNTMPVGMQIIGKPYEDYQLLALGSTYQHSQPYHLATPKLAASTAEDKSC